MRQQVDRPLDAGMPLREGDLGVTVSNPGQAQFVIVQVSTYPGLRRESAQALSQRVNQRSI